MEPHPPKAKKDVGGGDNAAATSDGTEKISPASTFESKPHFLDGGNSSLLTRPRYLNNSFKQPSSFRSGDGLAALGNRTSPVSQTFSQYLRFSSCKQQNRLYAPSSPKAQNNDCMISYQFAADTKHPPNHQTVSNNKSPTSLLTLNTDPTRTSLILSLNVGGSVYKLKETSIKRVGPDSRLFHFVQQSHDSRLHLCDHYFAASEEYFFERSAKLFDSIYKFYVTGQLHRPYDVCESEFLAELQFWRLPESLISTCCQPQFDLIEDLLEDLSAIKKRHPNENLRQRLHRFCEGDGTLASNVFTFVSICFVLISVLGLVLGSIEEFQIPYKRVGNQTVAVQNVTKVNTPSGVTWEPHYAFAYLELTCIIWFTIEFALRLTVTPDRWLFMRGLLNIVDLIAILPFYLELVLSICGFDVDSLSDIKGAFLVVRIMRVLRVVRILKLSRYSTGMRTFALTLRSSARQLGMMGMVLFTGVIFFSTLLYFVEKDDPETPFTSIPNAFWWAIVTMSTVGYGDQIPKTILGKTIASGAILSGVLVLALPITVIVDNFMKVSGSVQPRPVIHRLRPNQSMPPSPANGGSTISTNEKMQLTLIT